MKQRLSTFTLAAILGIAQSQIVGKEVPLKSFIYVFVDYLDGAGLFTNKTKFENSWRIINTTAYSVSL